MITAKQARAETKYRGMANDILVKVRDIPNCTEQGYWFDTIEVSWEE